MIHSFKDNRNTSIGLYNSEGNLQILTRTYFSIQHIQAAALFCRQCKTIEDSYNDKSSQDIYTELCAYATSTVFLCVSFLEAGINELFCDAADNPKRLNLLGEKKINLLANMWKMDIPRTASYSITEKYQIALSLLEKPQFDIGKVPFQDISILLRLRNALTHYEPKWFSCYSEGKSEFEELNNLSKQLIYKFEESSLFKNTDNSYFPKKCLGYGCAKWAVLNCIDFADEFYKKIEMEPPFNHVRNKLQTE
jgi:hypothetical protein